MNELTSRHYDNDEVNRIIRRALKLKNEDTISHQDLIDSARDIGLAFHFKAISFPHIKKFEKRSKSRHRKANFMMCNQ